MTGVPNDTWRRILENWLSGATVRVALVDNSTAFSLDVDNHDVVSDVLDGGTTAQEYSDASYSRQDLAGLSFSVDDPDNRGFADADDTTFPGLSGTEDVQGALVYVQEGGDDTTPGDDPIVSYHEGADYPKATNGSDFVVEWNSDGVLEVTNS